MRPPFYLAVLAVLLLTIFAGPAVAQAPVFDASQLPDGEYRIVVRDGAITEVRRARPIVLLKVTTDPVKPPPVGNLKEATKKALAKVEAYPKRDTHQQAIAVGYLSVAERMKGGTSAEKALVDLQQLRAALSGEDADKWAEFFTAADAAMGAPTEAKLEEVAGVLLQGEALNPAILAVIKRVVTLLSEAENVPDRIQRIARIAAIVISVLEALG